MNLNLLVCEITGIDEHGRSTASSNLHGDDSSLGWHSRMSSRLSSSYSARDSGLGEGGGGGRSRSCEDLHGKASTAASAVVSTVAAGEMSLTRGSETSLTDRVADIMERESPQRQVSSSIHRPGEMPLEFLYSTNRTEASMNRKYFRQLGK